MLAMLVRRLPLEYPLLQVRGHPTRCESPQEHRGAVRRGVERRWSIPCLTSSSQFVVVVRLRAHLLVAIVLVIVVSELGV